MIKYLDGNFNVYQGLQFMLSDGWQLSYDEW